MLGVVRAFALALAAATLAGCDRSSSSATPAAVAPTAPATTTPAPKASAAAHPNDRVAAGIAYIESTTGGADAETPLPLIVAIHGYGATPESLAPSLADLDVKARVVLPRGPDKIEGGNGTSWFRIGKKGGETNVAGLDGAAERLAVAIGEIAKSRPTRGRPIVVGFSQGGMLTFALALKFPDLVSAAFPIAGWMPVELIPARDAKKTYPKIIAMHGTADDVLPIGPTRDAVAKMKERGYSVELLEYAGVAHNVNGTMRERLHTLVGKAALEQAGK